MSKHIIKVWSLPLLLQTCEQLFSATEYSQKQGGKGRLHTLIKTYDIVISLAPVADVKFWAANSEWTRGMVWNFRYNIRRKEKIMKRNCAMRCFYALLF